MPIRATTGTRLRVSVAALLFVGGVTQAAAAQGNGKGLALGRGRSGPATTGSAAPAGSSWTDATVRPFGSWLDDASLLTPGHAWMAISLGHYRSLGGRQTDFPVVDAGIGLARRAQFGMTVPYYRLHFVDGTNAGGLGDVYLSGKVLLVDPSGRKGAIGLAVSPVLELTDDPAPGASSVTWAMPLNLEFRAARYRVFGSSGYFSRGALFGSGAVEVPVNNRVVVTGALSVMRSIKDDPAADALEMSRNRSDLTATAAYFVTQSIAIFAGTGRTIGGADGNGTSLMLTGGVSLVFAPRLTP